MIIMELKRQVCSVRWEGEWATGEIMRRATVDLLVAWLDPRQIERSGRRGTNSRARRGGQNGGFVLATKVSTELFGSCESSASTGMTTLCKQRPMRDIWSAALLRFLTFSRRTTWSRRCDKQKSFDQPWICSRMIVEKRKTLETVA